MLVPAAGRSEVNDSWGRDTRLGLTALRLSAILSSSYKKTAALHFYIGHIVHAPKMKEHTSHHILSQESGLSAS